MNDLQPAQVVLALSGLQFLYSIFQEVSPYYPVRIDPKMDPANGQNMDPDGFINRWYLKAYS
ncbi:MAG: hypothetical protein WAZ77_06250 [Candidatus Nitrosopolaris sp.]|jgi:hypothetical protein